MTILTEDEKISGIATADPKMGLYPVAIVEGLKAEVARLKAMQPKETAAPERLKVEYEWDIKHELTPAELNRLDREGWEFVRFEFKGDKLNAVIRHNKPAAPVPEKVAVVETPVTPEPTVKTVVPSLIIQPETIKTTPPPTAPAWIPEPALEQTSVYEQAKAEFHAAVQTRSLETGAVAYAMSQASFNAICANSRFGNRKAAPCLTT